MIESFRLCGFQSFVGQGMGLTPTCHRQYLAHKDSMKIEENLHENLVCWVEWSLSRKIGLTVN